MHEKHNEFVERQLLEFPGKDVLVYFSCRNLKPSVFGFYIWNGSCHSRTTIGELLQEGFEKADIKELRAEAVHICLVENISGGLEMREGKGR